MVKNSDRFIVAFNKIEKVLKTMVDKNDLGFSRLVKITSKYHAVLRRYRDDLLEFAQLRNAIVHNRVDFEYAIAEPHLSIVEQIEWIEHEITKPQLVYPMFKRKVYIFQETDPLFSLLHVIKQRDLSKFPIYRGDHFIGVLSEKGLAHWLAYQMSIDSKSISHTTVGEVMTFQEDHTSAFIKKSATVYEAEDRFKSTIGRGKRLDALLITENGQAHESLLGIITPRDIIDTVANNR
ncbi:MAG TPA: CBS domain-containing protein [Cerasibacillus sp.]|uniref:CBS domain-containing protein n=1 Tax=Cerasibacillus sp. TaxID=2498711 RepID=UPI002F3ED35C